MSMLLLIALLAWGFCAFLSWGIAHDRGAGGCAGLIVGALFGPLGIVIALLLPVNPAFAQKQQRLQIESQVRQGTLKQCPFCFAHIPNAATVCQHCGREQISPPRACAQCGVTNPPEYKFCGACGAALHVPPSATLAGH